MKGRENKRFKIMTACLAGCEGTGMVFERISKTGKALTDYVVAPCLSCDGTGVERRRWVLILRYPWVMYKKFVFLFTVALNPAIWSPQQSTWWHIKMAFRITFSSW